MAIQIGLVLFTYLTVQVLSQTTTQCYYTIPSPNININPYTGNKNCFYGCCNQNTYEPCCATPVSDDGLGPGAIGGIVIGVIVALIICGAVIFFCIRSNKKKKDGEKYMTPAKPAVSYITTSEVTDVTDLSRLPPLATYDDDKDYSHDATSYRSNKSDSYSQQSESKYPRPDHLSLNSQRPANSISSLDSREPPRSGSRENNRNYAPSTSSVDSRDPPRLRSPSNGDSRDPPRHRSPSSGDSRDPPRHRSPRSGHPDQRARTASNSSTGSRDRHQRHNRPSHHHHHQPRSYAHSVSSVDSRDHASVSERQSVTSNADSIGTTV